MRIGFISKIPEHNKTDHVPSPAKYVLPPKVFTLSILKLHSILAVANLLAHNNKSQICYCGQISLQSAAVNCSYSDNLTPLGVTFILLAMVLQLKFLHNKSSFKIGYN